MNTYTALFEHTGRWWIGYVEELPGANTQGETLEETRGNLTEAIQLIVEANRGLARRDAEGRTIIHKWQETPSTSY